MIILAHKLFALCAPTYILERFSRQLCGSMEGKSKYSYLPKNITEAGSCVWPNHTARKLLSGAHAQACMPSPWLISSPHHAFLAKNGILKSSSFSSSSLAMATLFLPSPRHHLPYVDGTGLFKSPKYSSYSFLLQVLTSDPVLFASPSDESSYWGYWQCLTRLQCWVSFIFREKNKGWGT